MSADKRSHTNFATFPGKINHDTNLYEFPALFKTTDSGKLRQWTIYIRLIKQDSKNAKETKKQNWNLLEETEVPLKDEYLEDDNVLPEGIISQIWTETGLVNGHISRSAASYPKAKNVGRANERGYFHQALSEARSKFLKKVTEGSTEQDDEGNSAAPANPNLYFPMLARQYLDYEDKEEDHKDAIKYPLYIQNKLNGSRLVSYLDCPDAKSLDDMKFNDVVLYTRQKKMYPESETNNKIRKALLNALKKFYDVKKNKSIYLDGEIYSHGMALQDIGSETRATESNADIQYWIYDCFYPHWKKEPFSERTVLLEKLYKSLTREEQRVIMLTPSDLVNTQKENVALFKKALADKYEGVMVRSASGAYAKSATKKSTALRSKDLLKRKKVFNEEFEVVDFTEGARGTSKGAIIWICKTSNGKEFKATPLGTNVERYALFKECKANNGQGFVKKYRNRMISVEYRELTNAGKPSHAKAVGFRDYE